MINTNDTSGRRRKVSAFDTANPMNGGMTETQVRKIVQDEMMNNYRSGTPIISPHQHNGNDNLQINQENIIPSTRASGSITFSSIKRYTLNTNSNPNPTLILCYGTAINSNTSSVTGLSPSARAHTFGTAQLGKSYYFQPGTSSSVIPGPIEPFIQSSSYIAVDENFSPFEFRALTDEENLVDIEYGGTIHARMTLVAFDKNTITLDVSHLDSGWSIIVNLVII